MDRRVDNIGRILLPKSYRKRMGIHGGDIVDISVRNNLVMVGRRVRRCAICDEEKEEKLHTIGSREICTECLEKAKTIEK